jgi:hypothetical protein
MTSNIDPTKPVAGNPSTADVRANFQTAANEISALQQVTQYIGAAYGPTGSRPTSPPYIGFRWYDTQLGYPVWVHQITPTVIWHNALGTPA